MKDVIYAEESYKIIGACFNVYRDFRVFRVFRGSQNLNNQQEVRQC